MKTIEVLDQQTIDKIAAGEVIERPASVVKELVENAIDAGANAVTVEIRDGGTSLIRITDNGEGIVQGQVPLAFLRHATSKIKRVEDLLGVTSLGFRGEALSSIAAVCQVELITKTAGSLTGTRYIIEGGIEKSIEEIGAPEGTTFLVRNIFFNTPARKKFLKSSMTEAGYINDLMERLALSHPNVSFKFISNNQTKMHTSGNDNLKDIIYNVYGRDIANHLITLENANEQVSLKGYIGKPIISRGNRNYENYFINGRYIKSSIIARAIEDAYKTFMMQHKYPFTAIHFTMDGDLLDINVHPTKMELRFADNEKMYQLVYDSVKQGLTQKELIPEVTVKEDKTEKIKEAKVLQSIPEPFEKKRLEQMREKSNYQASQAKPFAPKSDTSRSFAENPPVPPRQPVSSASFVTPASANTPASHSERNMLPDAQADTSVQTDAAGTLHKALHKDVAADLKKTSESQVESDLKKTADSDAGADQADQALIKSSQQLDLFEGKLLSKESVSEHRIIGQVFGTYWLVEFQEKLYIIDQHAAHEKVLYERTMKNLNDRTYTSQYLSPPIILTLSMQEEDLLNRYMDNFTQIGFEIEPFGGKEYSIRAVPDNLFGITQQDLFIEMLDSLGEQTGRMKAEVINEKIASMSCKAAVKGNHKMTAMEAENLIAELLTLENPYNCPHGRPTIISMTKYEMEKKFKRIV
ncbi:MAG: hypothetical protein RHS_0409 [Robinsoniella sp. RHS]|uniref:DNA mismatch repair endonuclease MutL n=1 Tax=Robinsoniella TaxID=588605 RepID=UPI00064ADDAE|nr:DNA mismatch repair endonuclease MutL [Robinsoniella peoriensis]KLU73553.1 MAG: hypothetical protein RHS_0409 [Robinsoniella sp. RHS]